MFDLYTSRLAVIVLHEKLQQAAGAHLLTPMTSLAGDTGQEESGGGKGNKMATGSEHGLKKVVWQSKSTIMLEYLSISNQISFYCLVVYNCGEC